MKYPARILCESDGCTVTFPDIPEAITCGDDEKDALFHAVDALESALDFYFEKNVPVPMPSAPKRGHRLTRCCLSRCGPPNLQSGWRYRDSM